MSTEPLEQAIESTRAILAGTKADQLDDPTPCKSWKVRDLINHIVGGQHFFRSGVEGTPPAEATDFASGDFLAAFDDASAACLAAFGAPGAMEKTCKLPFGEMPGSQFVGLASTDTFQHGWDLAKATGQPTDLNPSLAAALLAGAKMAIQEAFRGDEPRPFGPEQPAPAGASNADQLAAFLGRHV